MGVSRVSTRRFYWIYIYTDQYIPNRNPAVLEYSTSCVITVSVESQGVVVCVFTLHVCKGLCAWV